MRILHTGDIHLDSPFSGLPAKYAEERRRNLREAFSDMMRYAAEAAVDMVLICGDIFETPFVTRETVALMCRNFSMLECPVIITPGNHDPADMNSIWKKNLFPKNVYVFTSESLTKLSFDSLDCDVYGWAFTSSNMTDSPISGKKAENPDRINIIAGHADTQSPIGNKCPISSEMIKSFGADYCALSHIHNPERANAALDGAAYYCGCIEGRDFGECGEKGAYIVDVEKDSVNVNFKRFCNKVYRIDRIDITGISDNTELTEKIQSFADENCISSDTLWRVVLYGSTDPSFVINTSAVAQRIRGPFYTEIKDSTSPVWNSELLLRDRGIKGEVYRELLPSLESADAGEKENAARALRYALAALNGENISDM